MREALEQTSGTNGNISRRTSDNYSRQTRTLKKSSKTSKNTKKALQDYIKVLEKEIDECENKVDPSNLVIQTATTCEIARSTSNGKTSYQLITDTIAEDTYIFTDRPVTHEATIKTTQFVADFAEIFISSPPNAGLTLLSDDGSNFVGPVVVIFESAKNEANDRVVYDIEQSVSQNTVFPIESFFDGKTSDSVSFQKCSYFIDNWFSSWFTCPICEAAVETLAEIGSEAGCIAACITAVEIIGLGPEDPFADLVAAACPAICIEAAAGASSTLACNAAKMC